MRGRILQYNGNDGTGVVVVDGQQYRFSIALWRGDVAPAVGKVVDISMDADVLHSLMPVPDDVLMREKTAELTGKIGTFVGGLRGPGDSASSGVASDIGGSVVQRYGVPILAAYAAFLLGTLTFNAITVSFFGQSQGAPLYDIAKLLSQTGAGGGVKGALLLAYASVATPLVWRDRRGWLALMVPIVVVLWAVWSGYHAVSSAGDAMGEYGRDMAREVSKAFSFGFGFYVSLAAGAVLAAGGARRFLTAR